MVAITGKVKQVISGDTLVLQSPKSGAEKTLSLAYVSAPRLRREGDDPYAFQSRDFLRKLVVGKSVQFSLLYTVPSTNREYGVCTLPNGQSVVELAVSEGAVKVRDDAAKREEQPENEILIRELRIMEDGAKTAGKGLWNSSDDGRIETRYESPSDSAAFVEQYKGKKIDTIVERVLSGDKVAVRLMLEPKLHQQLVMLIAGVRCPVSRRADPQGNELPAEEFGEAAKEFVEQRLLQRSVTVVILGSTPQGQLVGNVIHPVGNIAEFLLSEGFGRCVDHHSTMLGAEMSKLRAAEKVAKDKKLRLFKGHVAKSKDSNTNFDAVVARIVSADTLIVRTKAGTERKINLSSVRQPKPTDPKQAPFQPEAKEFLRKKLIGKHVRVSIDGKRPAQDGYEEREMATVVFNNKNVALGLVEAGYCSVIRHRRDDTDRSDIYDELLAAEEAAQKEQKGMHAPKPPQAAGKMVEASESMQKAKGYLSFLQRQKRIPAVVDFVSSGSRFKVIIPRENARLTFVLSGIRAPRTARNPNEESEPFGPEALEWSTRRCMQRDVEVDIEDLDRVGGFIGTMYVNRENVAKGLLEEGLASVHAYSAEKTGHANELFAAETKAKQNRKGMWHDWTPEKDAEGEEDAAPANGSGKEEVFEKKKDYRDIIVTNIDDVGKLKIQHIGTGTAALEELMNSFRKFHIQPQNNKPIEGPPRAGEYVAAKFTEDDTFYRARVRHVDRAAKEAEVLYIDYGNSETIPFSRMRPLSQPEFQVSKLRAQAQDALLSFIEFPPQKNYADDAIDFTQQLTAGKKLIANVDYTSPEGVLHITIYDPSRSDNKIEDSLNAELIDAGMAIVPRKLRLYERAYPDVIEILRKKQNAAADQRLGMFEYGDITADD